MRGSCVIPHAFESTEEIAIIEVRRGSQDRARVREYSHSGTEALCDGVCYSFKVFGSRCAHYPECGDECKTEQGTETTRHGFKLHDILRRCGQIPSNLSLPAATSMVSEQSGRGQKLKLGHAAHILLHCSTPHEYSALFKRTRTIFRGPNLDSRPFISASGDLHILFPFLFGTWERV